MRQEDLLKANSVCETCGAPYYVCRKCAKMRATGIDVWKLHCCSHACYQVFLVVDGYKNNEHTKEEAKDLLENIGDVKVAEPMKATYDEIMAQDVAITPELTPHRRHRV